MIDNRLTFNAGNYPVSDRYGTILHRNPLDSDVDKINRLPNLIDLSINQNPLTTIPPFGNPHIRFLSMQDTSFISGQFPPSYSSCLLQSVTLSGSKIRTLHENDLLALANSPLTKLYMDGASISTIDPGAFTPLKNLQSLSLNNNQLKSAEFLSRMARLASVRLDGNQFSVLPPQLAIPGKVKMYSFKRNAITVIDELSPLRTWSTNNWTDIRIYLANNSIDCCLSLWLVGFLKAFPMIVADGSQLTCATPANLAGKLLVNLRPDDMHCGDTPSRAWWTTGRIIGLISGCAAATMIAILIFYVLTRRRRSRSGYTEIDDPYVQIDTALPSGPAFATANDDDEHYAAFSRVLDWRGPVTSSEAPTQSTGEADYAADTSHVDTTQIDQAAAIPRFV